MAKKINKILDANCRRTPLSGGMEFKGDIIDIDTSNIAHDYHWEIKSQNRICLGEWWEQTIGDCRPTKQPVLVIKLNRKGKLYWLAVTNLDDFLGNLKSLGEVKSE